MPVGSGWAAAGLAVLGRGFRSPRTVVDAHRRPQPPYSAGAGWLPRGDVHDRCQRRSARRRRPHRRTFQVGIVIDTEQLPIDDQIRETASAFNADPLGWVISGGDDHALAATFPSGAALPAGFTVIGEVVEGSGVEVPGYHTSARRDSTTLGPGARVEEWPVSCRMAGNPRAVGQLVGYLWCGRRRFRGFGGSVAVAE